MGGGFGGQQQQGGFGGGFGGQRFNQMPQQQGFGGGFGGQQGGFGNTFARTMPSQQGGVGSFDPGGIRSTPVRPPRQQGFGSSLGSFLGGQGFNMPQQRQQDMFTPQIGRRGPQQGFGPDVNNYARPMRNPMQQMGGPQPSQQERQYNQQMNAVSQNMLRQYGGDEGNPAYQAAMQAQDQQLRSQFGIPQTEAAQPGSLVAGPGSMNASQAASQVVAQPGGNLLGGAFFGGGSQPVLGTPGGNLVGGMDPRMLRPNVNRSLSQPQMPPNPYAQQVRQEDPRMQAMRMMQRMNFGGGGGYNF